jgi:hypothetical protein
LSYDEYLPIIEEKKKIDELMFGGESLLGIQNQVDDLVTAKQCLKEGLMTEEFKPVHL